MNFKTALITTSIVSTLGVSQVHVSNIEDAQQVSKADVQDILALIDDVGSLSKYIRDIQNEIHALREGYDRCGNRLIYVSTESKNIDGCEPIPESNMPVYKINQHFKSQLISI